MEVVAPVRICIDDKWRLSKKGSRREAAAAALPRSLSTPSSTFGRSNSCSSGSAAAAAATGEKRRKKGERCAFTRRCAGLVKEQRARFYIVRRCVTMLICWREYRDC
ncbi:hypothetical protein QJS04_geneDACA011307 [Acorus gramineus]|uniref:ROTUNDIFOLIA like 8 n=1 Tax=Acorus gramineus TaxID=55184 RepID=A0AAV9AJR0_ACOGR|nr:hypothetical protein QJS04_geneDACA011307 [Acorus gramineus]